MDFKDTILDLEKLVQNIISPWKVSKEIKYGNFDLVDIHHLIQQSKMELQREPSLLKVSAPVVVVGDTHGSLRSILEFMDKVGYPPEKEFLFLGNYVNRGDFDLEVLTLLLCYKCLYPSRFHLLRGNHECSTLTQNYGFFDICKKIHSIQLWTEFCQLFEYLPIAAVINNKIFCVQAGLSPELEIISQIDKIERPLELENYGLVSDMLWSDPEEYLDYWRLVPKGVSFLYGKDAINSFLNDNGLELIVRSHQVVSKGYSLFENKQLITIFSAVNNYQDFENDGLYYFSLGKLILCSLRKHSKEQFWK